MKTFMIKTLKITAYIILGLALVAVIAYQFRTDPIGRLAGKRLSGEEVSYPADWSFTREHMLIAVETRVDDPHSVTTICWVHEGELYVPARDGAEKKWPAYAVADAKARIKVGELVYPVSLHRVMTPDFSKLGASLGAKYPGFAASFTDQSSGSDGPASNEQASQGTWVFRVEPRGH